jgi:hypothetical protein
VSAVIVLHGSLATVHATFIPLRVNLVDGGADTDGVGSALRVLVALGPIISVIAFGLGFAIALNCDAPDWQQGLMLTLLPAVSAAGVGLRIAVPASTHRAVRVGSAILVALVMGAVAWFVPLVIWLGGCSS